MFRRQGARPAQQVPWPVRLEGATVAGEAFALRPLDRSDASEYPAVRRADRAWLSPWDATSPVPGSGPKGFAELVRYYDEEARAGRSVPLVIELDGAIVGQLTFSTIVLGSFRSCTAGYWVRRAVAGRGLMPAALAVGADHAFGTLGLHRVEVNIRPENAASLAVVRKLGFREEGLRPRLLHIDGDWRDHLSFALTVEDLAGETMRSRLERLSQQSLWRHTEAGPSA